MTLFESLEAFAALRFDVRLEGETLSWQHRWWLHISHVDVNFEMEADASSLVELEPKAEEMLGQIKKWLGEARESDNPFVRKILARL